MIEITPVPAFQDNYIWLIINVRTRAVAIVDPGDAAPVLESIRKLNLIPAAILITHQHRDHIGGIEALLRDYPIPVYGPATEMIPCMSHPLRDNDRVMLPGLNLEFKVLDVPGHTRGHIAYYGDGRLFIGDTLFMAGCGRLFDGTATQLYHSLNRVAKLPNETLIYCTHEYTLANLRFAQAVEPHNRAVALRLQQCSELRHKNETTIPATLACEKTTNPFLRTLEPEVITSVEKFSGHKLDRDVDVFTNLRKWKDQFRSV